MRSTALFDEIAKNHYFHSSDAPRHIHSHSTVEGNVLALWQPLEDLRLRICTEYIQTQKEEGRVAIWITDDDLEEILVGYMPMEIFKSHIQPDVGKEMGIERFLRNIPRLRSTKKRDVFEEWIVRCAMEYAKPRTAVMNIGAALMQHYEDALRLRMEREPGSLARLIAAEENHIAQLFAWYLLDWARTSEDREESRW